MFRDSRGPGSQHATLSSSLNCITPKAYSDLAPLERLLYTCFHLKNARRVKPTVWAKRNEGNSAAASTEALHSETNLLLGEGKESRQPELLNRQVLPQGNTC